MSFMDGFLGYDEIKMSSEDEKHYIQDSIRGIVLYSHAFWLQEC